MGAPKPARASPAAERNGGAAKSGKKAEAPRAKDVKGGKPKPKPRGAKNGAAAATTKPTEPAAAAAPAKAKDAMLGDVSVRPAMSSAVQTNKQKCLVLGSRNMSARDRHLLQDLKNLLPHMRENQKLPTRDNMGNHIIELCQLHHCNMSVFVEARKHDTAFLWLSQMPSGPSVKLQLFNVHTSDEIRMIGNCLKFSRAIIHFDREFDTTPHLRIIKSLLHTVFNTPRYHPRSKPFIDHMFAFFYLDDRIFFRHYQICAPAGAVPPPGETAFAASSKTELSQLRLMEIGPRFVMQPLTVLNGSFQGAALYKNPLAQSPTEQRRDRKVRLMQKAKENQYIEKKSQRHKKENPAAPADPLDMVFQ